jgi:hypothetical protein
MRFWLVAEPVNGPGRIRTCDLGIKVRPNKLKAAAPGRKMLQIGRFYVASN